MSGNKNYATNVQKLQSKEKLVDPIQRRNQRNFIANMLKNLYTMQMVPGTAYMQMYRFEKKSEKSLEPYPTYLKQTFLDYHGESHGSWLSCNRRKQIHRKLQSVMKIQYILDVLGSEFTLPIYFTKEPWSLYPWVSPMEVGFHGAGSQRPIYLGTPNRLHACCF